MKNTKTFATHILIHVLSGFAIAFLSSLLVYFKQKEYLHLGVVLFLVFAIYYSGNFLKRKIRSSPIIKLIALLLLIIICWLGPQIIYQIRPYTFYISGLAIAGIAIVIVSSGILTTQKTILFPWKLGIFLLCFIIGFFLPWNTLQYLILAMAVIMVILSIAEFKNLDKVWILVLNTLVIAVFLFFSKPLIFHQEQADYEDKVLFTANTQFHKMVITEWHNDQWVYIDKLKNISSIDEYLFYEPMAHSVFKVGDEITDVLVIGGENGCLVREVLKHKEVERIDIISYDTLLRNLGMELEFFMKMNQNSYQDPKVQILHGDLLDFVSQTSGRYDAIFIDLPDPRSIETNQYYTLEFYRLIKNKLTDNGIMITQAGSPYFASKAYLGIGQTIEKAGFHTLPIHNQILTLGEWGWYVCSVEFEKDDMKSRLIGRNGLAIETKWFNEEAARLVSAFGKSNMDTLNPGINTLDNPLVYQYYLKGNWELN